MRLCGLLMILSLALAEENDQDATCDSCPEVEEQPISVVLTKNIETRINSSLNCLIYNFNRLVCNWSTDSVPEDAQYSASFQYCSPEDEEDPVDHPLYCTGKECHGLLQSEYNILVKFNISTNLDWYVICQRIESEEIVKLDSPQNITASVVSQNLMIQWSKPRNLFFPGIHCFMYDLKINDEIKNLPENKDWIEYNVTNFDATKTHIMQLRTKPKNTCANNNDNWSEWSEAVVVHPTGSMNQLSVSVIVSIALVLPMILLALLLVCKFQRLFDKLFPSIPNPSKNVRMLLEKNEFNQVTPPKKSEEAEVIFEVME